MESKSVLVLVYSLSLSAGVGARRWNKYIKELACQGYRVFVVGTSNQNNNIIIDNNITYHTFDSKYPEILTKNPTTVIEKINYRLKLFNQKRKTKGAIYDKAFLDRDIIISLVDGLLQQYNISNLIITGAPFSLLYFGTKLKKKYPNMNLICDIRDAWTWGEGYGISMLKGEKEEYENYIESEVMMYSDFVTLASKDLKVALYEKYPQYNDKMKVLLNGIEFNEDKTKIQEIKRKQIVITHIGTVNIGTEKYWKPFLKMIENNNVLLQFIGCENIIVNNFVKDNKLNNINFINRVSEANLESYLVDSNFVLMFKKDGFENTFPTKFFDYIKNGRLIIAFMQKGLVSDEIEKNGLGKVFDEGLTKENLHFYLHENKNKIANPNYDKQKFAIENLSKSLVLLLK